MNCLSLSLQGNYVNFGVFGLYNDTCLDDVLNVALRMALSTPLEDILHYPKVAKSVYAFFDVLFRVHITVALSLDTNIFIQILDALHEGLQSIETTIASQCALTVDFLATYLINHRSRNKLPVQRLLEHLSASPGIIVTLLSTVFQQYFFTNNHSITKPIFSLLIASEEDFITFQENLIATQSPENQEKLRAEFDKLLADLSRSLDNSNREKFSHRLITFRTNIQGFLTT